MVALHIILRNLSLILLFLFGEEIRGVEFLQERIAFVLFVGKDGFHHCLAPYLFAARRWYAFSRQNFGYLVRRPALKEKPVDFPYNFRLFLIDDKVPVLSPVIAEEPSERNRDLTVCEPLPHAPGAVFRNAPAFLLRQRGHDGDQQLASTILLNPSRCRVEVALMPSSVSVKHGLKIICNLNP